MSDLYQIPSKYVDCYTTMDAFVEATEENWSTASLGNIIVKVGDPEELLNSVKRKRFKCELCESEYTQKFVLSQHIRRTHKKELPFRCDICPYAAVIRSELTQHKRKHGIFDRDYPCRYCHETFKLPRHRRVHETFHTGEVFTCTICHKVFREKNYYRLHLKSHAKVGCRFCDRSFRTVEVLEKHEMRHPENGGSGMGLGRPRVRPSRETIQFSKDINVIKTCILCSCNVNSLKSHVMKEHSYLFSRGNSNSNSQRWSVHGECPFCAKVVKTKSERTTHLFGHIGIVLYRCHLCDYKCNWIKNLKVHFQKHLNPQRVWKCDYCQMVCARKCQYTYHMMRKHGQRDSNSDLYLCEICGKEFAQKRRLDKHKLKAHDEFQKCATNTRPNSNRDTVKALRNTKDMVYQCRACKMNFEQEINFDRHMRLHEGGRYICKKCGTMFVNKTGLERHVKCHPEQLECHVCDSAFDSFADMKKHERLCNMQRVCFQCDNVTIIEHGDFLSAHLKEIHPSECLECDSCRKIFCSFQLFNEHIMSHLLQVRDPAYPIYNPTYDSEDEEMLGIWETGVEGTCQLPLRRHSLLSCECSICGDIFLTCKDLLEHEKTHKIPAMALFKKCTTLSAFRRERTRRAWEKVKKIRIFVLEGKTFAVEASLIPDEYRHVYFSDAFQLNRSSSTVNATLPSKEVSKHRVNIGRRGTKATSLTANAGPLFKELSHTSTYGLVQSQRPYQIIRTSLVTKSGHQLKFVHRKVNKDLSHSPVNHCDTMTISKNMSPSSVKNFDSRCSLAQNGGASMLQPNNELTFHSGVSKVNKLLILPEEQPNTSRVQQLSNLAHRSIKANVETSNVLQHIAKDSRKGLKRINHPVSSFPTSDSLKLAFNPYINSTIHCTKEFVIDIKIGERKVKQKVLFRNGRKRIITEDLGFFHKEIVLS